MLYCGNWSLPQLFAQARVGGTQIITTFPVVHSAVFGSYSYLLHLTNWACRLHESDIEGHMMRLTGVTCSFKHGCLTLHRTDPCFKNPLLFICHSMTSGWVLVVDISHCVVTITHRSLAIFYPQSFCVKKQNKWFNLYTLLWRKTCFYHV